MNRLSVIVVGVVIAYAAIATFVLVPLWQTAKEVKAEIGQAQLRFSERQNAQGANEEALLLQLQHKADQLGSYFLKTADDVRFFEYLESLAKNQSVEATVRFLQEPTPAKTESIGLELTVTGSLRATLNFLSALEVQPFAVRINEIRFQTDNATTGELRTIIILETVWE